MNGRLRAPVRRRPAANIEISVLTGTGGDQLTVMQSSAGRRDVRLRTSPTSLSLGPEIDLNGDGDYDLGMTQAGLVKVVGTGGADRIDASAVSTFPVQKGRQRRLRVRRRRL